MTTTERTAMPEFPIEFQRTVTFRTTVTAPDADAAYDRAMDLGDQLDGDPVSLGPVDDFSVTVPEQTAAVTG